MKLILPNYLKKCNQLLYGQKKMQAISHWILKTPEFQLNYCGNKNTIGGEALQFIQVIPAFSTMLSNIREVRAIWPVR